MAASSADQSLFPNSQPSHIHPKTPSPIVATINGREIGRVYLRHTNDLVYLQTPQDTTLHLPATPVLDPRNAQLVPNDASSLRALLHDRNPSKRQVSDSNTPPPSKKLKTVDPTAQPIPTEPASYYEKASEKPVGMTKSEDDTCLTCLKHHRKCKGTEIKIVKESKRCQVCAKPGKNTPGRVCYWKDPSRGIFTYEDAQRVLAAELGGRVLTKNTRADRLKRQQRAASQANEEISSKAEEASLEGVSDADETQNDEDLDYNMLDTSDLHIDVQDTTNGELLSAVDSAHQSLYSVIAQDLGLLEDDDSVAVRLIIEHAILGALTGSDAHRDRVEGLDEQVQRIIQRRVEATIALLEAMAEE